MDDNFILSKIQEKYPDLSQHSTENNLKAVISLIMSDVKFIMEIEKTYNLNTYEVIKIIYRNYDYIFNTCFTTKIQKIMKNKKYGKSGKTRRK